MKNKQLVFLFFCNFAIFFTGGALLPLLPLYALGLGATRTTTGVYLALIYLAITSGAVLSGRLAEGVPRKGLFVGAGALGVPVLVLHGYASALWHLVLLTSTVWFCAGVGTALVSVFVGAHADTRRRGRSFGLMFLARPLGSVLGGLTAGQLVAWRGYPLLFAVLAAVWAGWPVIALFGVEYRPISRPAPPESLTSGSPRQPDRVFPVLLLAAFLSTTMVYFGRLGTFLSMQDLSFSPQAVANTAAISALVTIPITLLLGPLSDRLGRRGLLMLCYLIAAAGMLMLNVANQFWQFGLATVLLLMTNSANGSVAPAFATDLLNPESMSRRLPWLNGMTWIGGVVGFAGAGYIIDTLGAATLYYLAVGLSLLAVALVGSMSLQHRVIPPEFLSWRTVKLALAHKKA